MLQSSKLSSRFKKIEEEGQQKEQPKRFVFSKSAVRKNEINAETEAGAGEGEFTQTEEVKSSDFDIEFQLKNALLEKIDSIPVWFEYTPVRQKELIKSFIENRLSAENINFSETEKDTLIDKLFTSIMGFGPLDYLIARENVDAVFVNGTRSVHIEIGGKVLNTEMKLNEKQMGFILNNISNMAGLKIDSSKSIWNCKIKDLLISVILPPVSQCGVNITLRKVGLYDIDTLLNKELMSREIFDFLVSMIDERKNIVISGDINSGKTTFLDTLINTVMINKRVVLLEEFPRSCCSGDTLMKFSVDSASNDYNMLISDILRMSPDYILTDLNAPVTEISDKAGNITTIRACSVDAAITGLISAFAGKEKLSEKYAKTKVLTNYDYIVQINNMGDGTRRVTSVVELTPARTTALSIKVIAKLVDNQYVTEIPQPLTSIRAESLISEAGSMSARFFNCFSTNVFIGVARNSKVPIPPNVFNNLFLNINEFWYSFNAFRVAW